MVEVSYDKKIFKAVYNPRKTGTPFIPGIYHAALARLATKAAQAPMGDFHIIDGLDTYQNLSLQRRHLVEAAEMIRDQSTIRIGGVIVKAGRDERVEGLAGRLAFGRLQYAAFCNSINSYVEAQRGIHTSYFAPPPDITDDQLAQGYRD